MKVSELISEIVSAAENIFGITNHLNDCVGVYIWYAPNGTWQVSLERPTRAQLDQGEVENPETAKLWESNYTMSCQDDSLVGALLALRDRLYNDDVISDDYFSR